jgi:hypothetical protein
MIGLTDLKGDNTVYRKLSGENMSVDSENVEDWKNYYHMKLKVYELPYMLMRQVYFSN